MPLTRDGGGALRILLVDDDREDRGRTADALRAEFPAAAVTEVSDEAAFRAALAGAPSPDIVITECLLGWSDGLRVLRAVREAAAGTPVVMYTGTGNEELCAEAMRSGLFDYIVKDPRCGDRLAAAVRAAKRQAAEGRVSRLGEEDLRWQQEELRKANEQLEERIAERTRVAEKRTQQLRLLASELTKAEERERRRLAQMLHDDLQQMLVAARMHIGAISPDIAPSRMLELMRHVDELLDRSITLSRNLTSRASPPVLYDAGLAPALEWLGRQFEEEHGLDIEVECDETAQPQSMDTRVLLYQACRELLFNVVKHAHCTECKLAMHHAGGGNVQVSVCDDGKGFDPDRTKEVSKGDGFGLFSIRERLEVIGGRMEIESVVGEGTCVRLYAPVRMSREELQADPSELHRTLLAALEGDEEEPATAPPHVGPPVRVLLADDHRIIRASLAGLLRNQAGIEVVGQAGDGREVIEKALALRPDVIVMDVTMPVVDGVEATRRLKAEMPDLFVIALSMHEKDDMQRAMREAGASRYLTKDGPPEMLIAAIRSTTRRKTGTPAG